MAANDQRVRMPSSMGGLVNYSDSYTSKLQFKPQHILIMVGVVMLVEIVLHSQG